MDYNAVMEYSSRNGLIENFGILEDEIHLAVISGDSCSGSVSCEADYKLTVIDRNQLKEFGEYSADGICDTRTQTWLVDYNGEMVSFEMLAAFCTDIPEDCKPNDNSSLIFAYSNTLGLDSDVAAKWFESVLKTESTHPSVTEFGSIRFDSPIEEDVQVHSSLAEAINSIAANLRSPLSGTPKNNVLDAIKTILRTRKLRTCGASLVVYVSNKALVFYPKIPAAQLRAKHIALFSREPDLGGGTSDLATLATKTYGYGVVSNLTEESDVCCLLVDIYDCFFQKFAVPLFGKPLCIYYQNVFVQGGKGSIELEPFVFDQQNGYATNRNKVANVFNGYPLFHEGTYTVKIDYDFPPGRQYQLSVRMFHSYQYV
uniref:VWFA domain-containing protein n=2 Tax=Caenorhabditis tropicalis TaxID=1561998 RepID=A0A1I7TTU2_9PELO